MARHVVERAVDRRWNLRKEHRDIRELRVGLEGGGPLLHVRSVVASDAEDVLQRPGNRRVPADIADSVRGVRLQPDLCENHLSGEFPRIGSLLNELQQRIWRRTASIYLGGLEIEHAIADARSEARQRIAGRGKSGVMHL